MDKEREQQFHVLFERYIEHMVRPDQFDRESFVAVLKELSEFFHLAKGTTEFYKNRMYEAAGEGEILSDYDNGNAGEIVFRKRLERPSGAVIIGTAWGEKDKPPLSEEEMKRLEMVEYSLLSFVSRNRLEKAIETLAFYDEYSYPNVRYFMRHLAMLQKTGKIRNKTAVALNLRHFSMINQQVGRELGDQVMRSYYEFLSMAVGEDGIVCRVGGDNFTMIFDKELTPQVEEILRGMPVVYDREKDRRIMVSASAGIFFVPDDPALQAPGEIMERIMVPMNFAKAGGEGAIVYFDAEMAAKKNKKNEIQTGFPEALKNREFHVYYQPKVDVRDGRIVGAEALCRWIRDGKVVSPADFIPALEEGGYICELDFYMLDSVCAMIAERIRQGKSVIRVSVNLSRKHLMDADLLGHLLKIIERYDIPRKYIEIELTETTTEVGFRGLKNVVAGLQEEGICTSVDDFGMGYSSLNLIREIPWDVLKVDRCFLPVDEFAEKSTTGLMYRHVVAMGRELGLECITEGVETRRQVELLRENECFIAQGYYFDKPLPFEEFEKKLDKGFYEI
ncbi:MAG: bifunctional diguanylate cyclase/phosphodiesterase [Lachnospiraceae bacterium]|nr:bifunctional diguanylate cyclase/phosphodiesterase [Lachnospiraceae bacterium]